MAPERVHPAGAEAAPGCSPVAALRAAINRTRSTYVEGTPERYPNTQLRGLTVLDAEGVLQELERCAQDGSDATDEASVWEERYNELLDAVGGVWPG